MVHRVRTVFGDSNLTYGGGGEDLRDWENALKVRISPNHNIQRKVLIGSNNPPLRFATTATTPHLQYTTTNKIHLDKKNCVTIEIKN